VDRHNFHILKEFIQFCQNYSIIALYLPSYITHILQPLDISVFAPLIKAYKKQVYDYNIYDAFNIDKSNFLELLLREWFIGQHIYAYSCIDMLGRAFVLRHQPDLA
jgi:hypothetical protein